MYVTKQQLVLYYSNESNGEENLENKVNQLEETIETQQRQIDRMTQFGFWPQNANRVNSLHLSAKKARNRRNTKSVRL